MRFFRTGFRKGTVDPLYSFWGVPQGEIVVGWRTISVVCNVDQAMGVLTPMVRRGDLTLREALRIIDRMRGDEIPAHGIHLLEVIRQMGAECSAFADGRDFVRCTKDSHAPPHGTFIPWPTPNARMRSVGAAIGRVREELVRPGTNLTVEEGTWLIARALQAGLTLKPARRPIGHLTCVNSLDAVASTFVRQG